MVNTQDCWLYAGYINSNDYGLVFGNRTSSYAHRVMYENIVSKIDEGLQIDHLCRVRQCINPEHLEPVSRKENILRGNGIGAQCARKTHCPKGHELAGHNIIWNKLGHRRCRICNYAYLKRYRLSKV